MNYLTGKTQNHPCGSQLHVHHAVSDVTNVPLERAKVPEIDDLHVDVGSSSQSTNPLKKKYSVKTKSKRRPETHKGHALPHTLQVKESGPDRDGSKENDKDDSQGKNKGKSTFHRGLDCARCHGCKQTAGKNRVQKRRDAMRHMSAGKRRHQDGVSN